MNLAATLTQLFCQVYTTVLKHGGEAEYEEMLKV